MKEQNAITEVIALSNFLEGMAAAFQFAGHTEIAEQFSKASDWLDQTADHVCGAGFWCMGGESCTSDHK